tara:strand:- start:7370 stop:7798 length:429 start_codon:yes stop_codon:yes gene_type:complete
MARIDDVFEEDMLKPFRRLYGHKWTYLSEVPYWSFPVFVLCWPYLYLSNPERPPFAFTKVCIVFAFTIWLVQQPYAIGLYMLLAPLIIIGIISGGMDYPLRMIFDSTRLVQEVISGRYGVIKHDGNSNEGMATGISVGLSED